MNLGLDTVVLGLITGMAYAILAVGLSLIYKSARFVNFAHGNLGALAAVLLGKLAVDFGVPYWIAFAIAVVGAGALGALVELTIIRRLFDASRLVLVVATIALSQLFLFLALQRWLQADQEALVTEGYPIPFDLEYRVGDLLLRGPDVAILLVVPLLGLALAAFFRFSPYGQAIRAAAENPDAARLAGISVRRMSTIVWTIAGVLAGVTAILLAPNRPVFQIGSLGPSILVRALGASLIGRMTNLPIAFGAGLLIGIVEAVAFANVSQGGVTDLVVFVVIMGALVFQARELSRASRRSRTSTLGVGATSRPLPRAVRAIGRVRRLRAGSVVAGLAAGVVLPLLPVLGLNSSEKIFLLTLTVGYAIVGLSLTVLTGWAGQLSLGQFALVGVGAFAASRFAESVPFPVVTLLAGLVGVLVATAIGIPALRIQGLFLAVSTLAFAVVAEAWIFQQELFVVDPSGVFMPRPGPLSSEEGVYYFALALLVLFVLAARNLRGSGPGRLLIAVRDNDDMARSTGISAAGTRLLAFSVSGFMAACAGVIFAYARQNFTATAFAPDTSLQMLLMVIIGGLGSIPGAILGAAFLFGLPAIFGGSDLVQLATGAVGVLVVLLYLPGGLISLVHKARDAWIGRIVRRERGLPPPPSLVPPIRELWATARGDAGDGGRALGDGAPRREPDPRPDREEVRS